MHDAWNVGGDRITFFTREQALDELIGLDIITFDEEEADGTTTEGAAKHWHAYHIIARSFITSMMNCCAFLSLVNFSSVSIMTSPL